MSMRLQRDRIINELGGESGKVNDRHVFIVKNLEKRKEKQYWVPVPGAVISQFVTGGHDWRYLGPRDSEAVKAKIAEIDRAQTHIVGEQKKQAVDDFEIDMALSDLGFGATAIPEALDTPIEELVSGTKKKSGVKHNDISE